MAATITLFPREKRIIVHSILLLYGSEANTETGERIVEEINRMYNEPDAKLEVKGQGICHIIFDVTYQVISSVEAQRMIARNDDFRNNFIRIENENRVTRSFMGFGLGDNSGHWLTTDNLGTSTTAAHEFGHSLGLDHPEIPDFRGSNAPPPIMAARGSLVDPQYQWSPLAKAGEYGGTMNPMYRKVTAEEIAMIMEGLSFEVIETYYVGFLSNNLFDKNGTVLGRLA